MAHVCLLFLFVGQRGLIDVRTRHAVASRWARRGAARASEDRWNRVGRTDEDDLPRELVARCGDVPVSFG